VFCYDDTQSFNNQTDVWEYGFGCTTQPTGCPTANSGYVRHKKTTYKTDASYVAQDAVHLVSLPIKQQVMDGGDSVTAETDYTYDGGSPSPEPAGPITAHATTASTSFPSFAAGNDYTCRDF